MWDSSRIHRYLVSWKEIILTAATTTRRSIAVVNEVGPPLLCLHPSIAVGGFGNPDRLPLDGGTSGGPVSLHNAIECPGNKKAKTTQGGVDAKALPRFDTLRRV